MHINAHPILSHSSYSPLSTPTHTHPIVASCSSGILSSTNCRTCFTSTAPKVQPPLSLTPTDTPSIKLLTHPLTYTFSRRPHSSPFTHSLKPSHTPFQYPLTTPFFLTPPSPSLLPFSRHRHHHPLPRQGRAQRLSAHGGLGRRAHRGLRARQQLLLGTHHTQHSSTFMNTHPTPTHFH